MPDVQDTVGVHPETVANAEKHASERQRERWRAAQREYRRRRKGTAPSAVKSTKVDERVWATALQLAGGDALRLDVRAWDVVVVLNHSKRRKVGEQLELVTDEQLSPEAAFQQLTAGLEQPAPAQPRKRKPRGSRPSKHGRGQRETYPAGWWTRFETPDGGITCPREGCGWSHTGDKLHLALTTHYRRAHGRRLVDDYPVGEQG